MARQTPLVSDALDEYLTTRTHLAANMLINDRSQLHAFARFLGPIQVGHLTAQHVEAYFVGRAGITNRMNARSYNKARQRVNGFVGFLASRGYNRKPLMANIHARKVFERDRLRLTPAQMLALYDVADNPRDRCMLAVACNLGLRAGELTTVQIRDVNLEASTLHVVISKSGIEDHMPISADLAPELRRWLRKYQDQVRRPLGPDDFLFPTRHAPRLLRMDPANVQAVQRLPGAWRPEVKMTHPARVVQIALRRIGLDIDPGERFHTLRRSAGRAFFDHLAALGHDEALRMTSAFLHHSSTQVTEKYLGLQHERVKRDHALKNLPFLTSMVSTENVTPIRRTGNG